MGNRVVKASPVVGHYIAADFLKNKVINDGNRYLLTNSIHSIDYKKLNHICNVSINQINRVEKPLTKADLISILMKINPVYINHYDEIYKYMSVKDLNYMIRHEVYNNCVKDVMEYKPEFRE